MIELSYFGFACLIGIFLVLNLTWYAHGVLAERRDWMGAVARSNLHVVHGTAYRVYRRSETPSREEVIAAAVLASRGRSSS
jgi:hypothetical protein